LILSSDESISFEMRTLRVLAEFHAAPSHKTRSKTMFLNEFYDEKGGRKL